jgi:hypothetical protein
MLMHLAGVRVLAAPPIREGSFLQDAQHADFRRAYEYASWKQRAIEGLAKLTPEDAYFVWRIIQRGMERQNDGQTDAWGFVHYVAGLENSPQRRTVTLQELIDRAKEIEDPDGR